MKQSKPFYNICIWSVNYAVHLHGSGIWCLDSTNCRLWGEGHRESGELRGLALPGGYVAGLTDATFHKPVTNFTATWRTSSSGATFCQVVGWMWPEIKFQVTMPTVWNERYQMNGGGGWDGSLSTPNAPNALATPHPLRTAATCRQTGRDGHIRHGRTILQHILQY